MHDAFNNLTPPHISNIFTYIKLVSILIIHDRHQKVISTLNTQDRIRKVNLSLDMVCQFGTALRNEMHNLSKHKFKVKLRNVLLQILTETDDYIELSDLIMKIS